MSSFRKTGTAGVLVRHRKGCPHNDGGACACVPVYRGEVWNSDTKRPDKSPSFDTLAEAEAWVLEARTHGQRYRRREDGQPTPAEVAAAIRTLERAGFVVTSLGADGVNVHAPMASPDLC